MGTQLGDTSPVEVQISLKKNLVSLAHLLDDPLVLMFVLWKGDLFVHVIHIIVARVGRDTVIQASVK